MEMISHDTFLERCNKVHDNFYDYSKVIYKGAKFKIDIICPKHGEFAQTAGAHSWGSECPQCKFKTPKTIISFFNKANKVHDNFYDYSKVNFTSGKDKITIICPKHGEFTQRLDHHLNDHGCDKCARGVLILSEFISKANEVHDSFYDYSKVNFISGQDKIIIICPKHGEFTQIMNKHLTGNRCKWCANELTQIDKYKNKKTILYYIYFPDFNLYKIGLTQTSVHQRYKRDSIKIEILSEKTFLDGREALKLEQNILFNFKHLQYKGDDIISGGNTEIFITDIFKENNG